jgi:Putative N-acetylmannosamine-6-phosphate epimerase
MNDNEKIIQSLKGKLIVSCQALPSEPLYDAERSIMPYMAKAAELGGAAGIRCNTVRDVEAIKKAVSLPVIAIIKRDYEDSSIYITPTMKEIDELIGCQPEIIAFDFTDRIHPGGISSEELYHQVREKYPDQLLMADISCFAEAKKAAEIGFDFVGTTLSGYVEGQFPSDSPDFELIERISQETNARCIAEGKIHTPEQAQQALAAGAYCVVVGGAITRPLEITRRFAAVFNH